MPYPSADEARALFARLQFSDKRRAKGLAPRLGPEQLFHLLNQVGRHAEGAKISGDMATHDSLREWIRCQRSTVHMPPPQRA